MGCSESLCKEQSQITVFKSPLIRSRVRKKAKWPFSELDLSIRATKMDHFDQNGRLDHFGPVHFPTVPRPLPRTLAHFHKMKFHDVPRSTEVYAILVAISLALCDFKSLRFEIAERFGFVIWASRVFFKMREMLFLLVENCLVKQHLLPMITAWRSKALRQ